MLKRFFRRQPEFLHLSAAELTDTLRAAAKLADVDSVRIELTAAADALDRATTHAQKDGNVALRNDVFYALGRARLDLRDQIGELIETSKETHILMQQVHTAQGSQEAAVGALRAEFQTFGETISGEIAELRERWDELVQWRNRVEATLAAVSEFRQESTNDRAQLRTAQQNMDTRHGEQIAEITRELHAFGERLEAIERALEVAGDDHHEAGG